MASAEALAKDLPFRLPGARVCTRLHVPWARRSPWDELVGRICQKGLYREWRRVESPTRHYMGISQQNMRWCINVSCYYFETNQGVACYCRSHRGCFCMTSTACSLPLYIQSEWLVAELLLPHDCWIILPSFIFIQPNGLSKPFTGQRKRQVSTKLSDDNLAEVLWRGVAGGHEKDR